MMVNRRTFLCWWIGGLIAFAITIAIGTAITGDEVTWGILDHQSAATAIRVDEIQTQWRDGGVLTLAKIAMVADFIFIGIFGIGGFLGGLYFRAAESVPVRLLGSVILVGAVVFLATDYAETIAQFIQLMQFNGDDALAGFAASMGQAKVLSWLVIFLGPIIAFVLERPWSGSPS